MITLLVAPPGSNEGGIDRCSEQRTRTSLVPLQEVCRPNKLQAKVLIEEAIEFAQFNVDQDWRWDGSQETFIERVQDGLAAWDRLKQDTGFDLGGVFRRRALVPFVL